MHPSTRAYRSGWAASLLLHAAAAVILFFVTVRQYLPEPNFVEMTWGAVSATGQQLYSLPASEPATQQSTETAGATDESINLPQRRFIDIPDDVLSVRDRKRSLSADVPVSSGRPGKIAAEERRTSSVSTGFGTRENALGASASRSNNTVAAPFGAEGGGGGTGNSVGYSLQWTSGGNRALLSGDVPAYPPGVNVSAQIKLRVIVLPNGSVKAAAPAQKGETRLENAAIAKVKLWKFEPLLAAQPQLEQICTITFNFTLQ
ncbi:MAG: hypothetical protein F9K22_10645 [Bacteroidetes bacterium]|nr:MAG: hypothetical protein F9K22_10645 [Bacteroidota bacterium]